MAAVVSRRWVSILLALVVGCGACAGAGSVARQPPNIIFVLADDLSWNLVQYMPNVLQMQRDGMTFTDYTVSNSLCCPSRATTFSGRYPHNTGVFTNNGPDGGWELFHDRGEEDQTFAVAQQSVGYRTAMMGKYLNGYSPVRPLERGGAPYVPPGWNDWVAPVATARFGFNYQQNENGEVVNYGDRPEDYLTDVLARKATSFMEASTQAGTPFMLEVAPFAPHDPAVPAPRDAEAFPGLQAPRGPAFDQLVVDGPDWLSDLPPSRNGQVRRIDQLYRLRAQSVLAVDALVASVREAARNAGVADRTYIVFGSDNGVHLGEHRLPPGKETAFEIDITVPLIVTGPGVPAGTTRDELVQNVDLAPTFLDLSGAAVADSIDGRSFLPLLLGEQVPWRTASLIEHHGQVLDLDDPDASEDASGVRPPTYEAIRTQDATFVMYETGEVEYYDLVDDPDQLVNIAGQLTPEHRDNLGATVAALAACRGGAQCWAAGQLVE